MWNKYYGTYAVALAICLLAQAQIKANTPAEAVEAAARDILLQPESLRPHLRYLYRPGTRVQVQEFDAVVRYASNGLSRKGDIEPPVRVAQDIWRIDFRHYGWKRATWEKFADLDTYFHIKVTETHQKEKEKRGRAKVGVSKTKVKARSKEKATKQARVSKSKILTVFAPWVPRKSIESLAEETESNAPIIRADWWLSKVSRQLSLGNKQEGVGYYDFLGVKNRNDFFKLARLNVDDPRFLELDRRGVAGKSGVSEQNRQIERLQAYTGSLYFTLDTDDASGAGNAVRNLRRGDYIHQAEEHYLTLPNGLPAYFLCNADGTRQDSAPDFIGPDSSPLNTSNDGRIHICIGCIRCHAGEVLKPIDDWARKNYTIGRLALLVPSKFNGLSKDKQYEVYQELKRQYLSDLKGILDADRITYQRGFIAACGVDANELSRRFARAYHGYIDDGVGPEEAAREYGVTVSELRIAFTTFVTAKGALDPQLGGLIVIPPERIPRIQFEELYPLGWKYLKGDLRD